jgi:cytochrome c5
VVCIATMMGSKAMVDISCLCLAAVLIAMLAIVAWNPPYVNSGTGKSAWTGADILQEVMLAIQLMALSIGILQRELPAKYEKTVELALLAFLVVPIAAAFVWSYVDYAARVDNAKASDNRAIARHAKQPRSVQIRSVKAESGTPVYAKTCSQCLVTSSLVGFVASIVILSGLSGETVLELAMPVSQGGTAVQMEMVCPDGPVSTRASPDDCQTTQTSDDGLCVDPEDPYFCSAYTEAGNAFPQCGGRVAQHGDRIGVNNLLPYMQLSPRIAPAYVAPGKKCAWSWTARCPAAPVVVRFEKFRVSETASVALFASPHLQGATSLLTISGDSETYRLPDDFVSHSSELHIRLEGGGARPGDGFVATVLCPTNCSAVDTPRCDSYESSWVRDAAPKTLAFVSSNESVETTSPEMALQPSPMNGRGHWKSLSTGHHLYHCHEKASETGVCHPNTCSVDDYRLWTTLHGGIKPGLRLADSLAECGRLCGAEFHTVAYEWTAAGPATLRCRCLTPAHDATLAYALATGQHTYEASCTLCDLTSGTGRRMQEEIPHGHLTSKVDGQANQRRQLTSEVEAFTDRRELQVVDVDCDGSWSACTSSCETANDRTWTESTGQSGSGAACPSPSDCQAGEDDCPAVPARGSGATDAGSSGSVRRLQDCATPNAAGDADCANFVSSNGCDPMFNFGGTYGG